ncbi:MAG: Kelch repeat-containing protein [Chitinophaga sp.]
MQKAGIYCWILAAMLAGCKKDDSSDDDNGNWKKGYPELSGDQRAEAVVFVIGDTAYLGTGINRDGDYLRDFMKFTENLGWTQIADLPEGADARSGAVAFVVGETGYVGTGQNENGYRLSDFWSYSPSKGYWEKTAPLKDPENASRDLSRKDAVAFAVKDKGYVATGWEQGGLNDVWQYVPAEDKWYRRRSFEGSKRSEAVAFVIQDIAYIATGVNNGENKVDFWMYKADEDDWVPMRDIANTDDDQDYDDDYDIACSNAAVFVKNNKAYISTGTKGGVSKQTWEYDPVTDLWTQMREFEGAARTGAVGFTLKNVAYLSTGRSSGSYFDDTHSFDPDETYDEKD